MAAKRARSNGQGGVVDPAQRTLIEMDDTFGSDSHEKSQELKVIGMTNMSTECAGATAVPKTVRWRQFPPKRSEHVLMGLSAAKLVLLTEPENSIKEVAAQIVTGVGGRIGPILSCRPSGIEWRH